MEYELFRDKLDKLHPHYDWDSTATESFSWCIGAGNYIDISQFEQEEILYSEEFDTYCVKHFCGFSDDCFVCKHIKKLIK